MDRRARHPAAPDLVIVGAARSGTSFLAAQLGAHPRIDPGSVKEPNFFSRHFDRGFDWYDGLFEPRRDGVLRMDASVSYTFPHFPLALERLAAAAPDAHVVYVVRDPLPRAVSHYLFYRHYFQREAAADFGTAIRDDELYVGASDYPRWLAAIDARFPPEQVLIVPFPAVAARVVSQPVCAQVGLPPVPEADQAAAHQNNVVTFKNDAFRIASRTLRRSRLYPVVRDKLGAQRLRRLRSLLTRAATLPSAAEALATCTPEQMAGLRELEQRSRSAVQRRLREQDARLGWSWLQYWQPADSGEPAAQSRLDPQAPR